MMKALSKLTSQDKQSNLIVKESPSSNKLELIRTSTADPDAAHSELDEYEGIFKFGDFGLMIPFEKLDDTQAL